MKQNFTNVPWNFIDDVVVPVGIANVALLKIFFLIGKGGPCVGCVGNIQAVLNAGQFEMLDNLHGVRLRRLVNAVTPCKVLSCLMSVNSDFLSLSATICSVGPLLVVVILNPILYVRGEGA